MKSNAVNLLINTIKNTPNEGECRQLVTSFLQKNIDQHYRILLMQHLRLSIACDASNYHLLEYRQILYCSALGAYTCFHLIDFMHQEITCSHNLHHAQLELADYGFVRIQRSCIINCHHIIQYSKNFNSVTLRNGQRFEVSQNKDLLMHWLLMIPVF